MKCDNCNRDHKLEDEIAARLSIGINKIVDSYGDNKPDAGEVWGALVKLIAWAIDGQYPDAKRDDKLRLMISFISNVAWQWGLDLEMREEGSTAHDSHKDDTAESRKPIRLCH